MESVNKATLRLLAIEKGFIREEKASNTHTQNKVRIKKSQDEFLTLKGKIIDYLIEKFGDLAYRKTR